MTVSQFLLDAVLEDRFGLETFRPKQQEVIDALIEGKHTLAVLPTSYGKSLCYQLPSQIFAGITLVVSPLIALMQDQLSGLLRRGIYNATSLNSSIGADELNERMDEIRSGARKLVYVAPERFESPKFRKLLDDINISLVVIDEAHCISHWGHDFRLQYRNLSTYLSHLKNCTILALTATATPQVQRDIVKTLGLPRMNIITACFDRPNLRFEARALASGTEKDKQLLKLLQESQESAIVYASSRKETERLAVFLREKGFAACFYHAGMIASERQRSQKDFETGACSVIVSTVAFGMGIDKSNIRLVVHYNMPSSLENYYQEAGRAGRDGRLARCVLLYQPKDISTQKWLISKNYPSKEDLQSIFKHVLARGLNPVKAQELAKLVQINENALMSGLSLLKQLQLIDSTPDGAFFERHSGEKPLIDMTLLSQRKEQELLRLQHIVRYVSENLCRREMILDYFGQALLNKCSGCDVCG